ncbi:hypothetical protein [Gimesia fumaroli]|uniref:Carboxypeptidase regulatory-like domain-containing protein n=1 Tax=Gimesia fumaroli TaxID=2527976 RepID=A0A518IBP3_9PLAN|nr:hypothetical protein [Gimesia fumaroli]QDV50523.1 hypothetical protein Enr17x_25640 [Gimesia fumaroli]
MQIQQTVFLTLITASMFSCSSPEQPFTKQTYPVKGKISVDGKEPGSPIQIQCLSTGEIDTEHPTASGSISANDGTFELSTYTSGDGIPPGDYTLTFVWKKYDIMSRGYSGPDKLKKRYDKPEKSKIKFSVVEGKPTDLGTIELTTK